MEFNELRYKKINIDEFIKVHNHINYCEAIMFQDGEISYAVRSHLQALIKATGETEDYIYDIMPISEMPLRWLIDYTKCVGIWYNMFIAPSSGMTDKQKESLNKLIENKIVRFK